MAISRIDKLISFFIFLIVPGSIFITSRNFVNEDISPKFYYTIIYLLINVVLLTVVRRKKNINELLLNDNFFFGIVLICFLQACLGLCQYFEFLQINHTGFSITGSFSNPAGYTSALCVSMPFCLYLFFRYKKYKRVVTTLFMSTIIISIMLSSYRTGIVTVISTLFVCILCEVELKNSIVKKWLIIGAVVFLFFSTIFLYLQRKDSANGRILIWIVSFEMIKDKPFFGHGINAFKAKYMDYQAEYFKYNVNTKYSRLADNVKHPFNEFIKVTVEYGIFGLTVVLSFLGAIIYKALKLNKEYRSLVLGGITAVVIFSLFSYPLQYAPLWLMLILYIIIPFSEKINRVINLVLPVRKILRICIVMISLCLLGLSIFQLNCELKWKEIAMKSLRGNTHEMLPYYKKLDRSWLIRNPLFLYNYGAELNIAKQYEESNNILNLCSKQFNDYDLQMIIADNYRQMGDIERAIKIYKHTSNMIPCRFLPQYRLFEIYKNSGKDKEAKQIAMKIVDKEVKIASGTVTFIKMEAEKYLSTQLD